MYFSNWLQETADVAEAAITGNTVDVNMLATPKGGKNKLPPGTATAGSSKRAKAEHVKQVAKNQALSS